MAAYAAAKAGINHLTQTMAVELGPSGIRVLAIAPGTTLTETVRDAFDDDHVAALVEATPLRRMSEPDELGRLAVLPHQRPRPLHHRAVHHRRRRRLPLPHPPGQPRPGRRPGRRARPRQPSRRRPMIDTAAVTAGLAPVREVLQSDGGDIELVGVEGGTARLRLVLETASCAECVLPRADARDASRCR